MSIVGQDAPFNKLKTALQEFRAKGVGGAIVLEGPVGCGKTFMCTEAARECGYTIITPLDDSPETLIDLTKKSSRATLAGSTLSAVLIESADSLSGECLEALRKVSKFTNHRSPLLIICDSWDTSKTLGGIKVKALPLSVASLTKICVGVLQVKCKRSLDPRTVKAVADACEGFNGNAHHAVTQLVEWRARTRLSAAATVPRSAFIDGACDKSFDLFPAMTQVLCGKRTLAIEVAATSESDLFVSGLFQNAPHSSLTLEDLCASIDALGDCDILQGSYLPCIEIATRAFCSSRGCSKTEFPKFLSLARRGAAAKKVPQKTGKRGRLEEEINLPRGTTLDQVAPSWARAAEVQGLGGKRFGCDK